MGLAYITVLHTNIFYIQSTMDTQTKHVSNVLVKRAKECHSPEFMYINARNIIMIEPVEPDSQVTRLIKATKAHQPEGGKK